MSKRKYWFSKPVGGTPMFDSELRNLHNKIRTRTIVASSEEEAREIAKTEIDWYLEALEKDYVVVWVTDPVKGLVEQLNNWFEEHVKNDCNNCSIENERDDCLESGHENSLCSVVSLLAHRIKERKGE